MLFTTEEFCFNNLQDYWKSLASGLPDTKADDEHIHCVTGINDPLYNPIFPKKEAGSLPVKIANTTSSFWYMNKRNPKITSEALSSLAPIMEKVPVMSIKLDKEFRQNPVPDVQIEILSDGTHLNDWIQPIQIAFEMNDAVAKQYQTCLEKNAKHFVHFIAKTDNKIIAAASLFLHKDIAGLYNLAVVPEYRTKGIGTALHCARLNEARKQGYNYATLQATPMATHLDESLGFEKLSELTIYKY